MTCVHVCLGNVISGNWRITFRFDAADAIDVSLEDYH